jgi:hypothetical protein
MNTRTLIAGDLLALFAFAMLGLASHEHEITPAALARTFLPFAVAWLIVGGLSAMFVPTVDRRPRTDTRFLLAYLVAGLCALVARSIIFDRALVNAFFLIALVGNGLFLFAWRTGYAWWQRRRPPPASIKEPTRP